jgi:hypothetical protein
MPARFIPLLVVLAGLSFALIGLLPAAALARPVFQSPPPTPRPTVVRPVVTGSPTLPATRAVRPITPTIPRPTAAITATTSAPPLQVEPAIPGYLPPPTLSVPGGRSAPLLPDPGQPLVAPRMPTPSLQVAPIDPAQTAAAQGLAQLIDTVVVAFGYAWLCCGVIVLMGATLILVWLVRRSKRT